MAFEIIANTTDLTIERETVLSGTDAEGNPIYPERITYHAKVRPNRTVVHEDPTAQRILDKAADFRQVAQQAEGVTVTTQNAVARLQDVIDQFPDVLRALAWIGERFVEES